MGKEAARSTRALAVLQGLQGFGTECPRELFHEGTLPDTIGHPIDDTFQPTPRLFAEARGLGYALRRYAKRTNDSPSQGV